MAYFICTGGLLVLVDRKSRRYVIEKLEHVTQDDVVAALKRMIARKALGRVRSVTTDNGYEFLDPKKIKAFVGCDVYHTRAYASREKGSVENCNRFVRMWYPKGTDFGKCTHADGADAVSSPTFRAFRNAPCRTRL